MYTGIGASAGIGIGSAVIVKEPSLAYDNKAVSDVDAEKQRLTDALDKCIAKTQAMADDMKERVGEKEAEILGRTCPSSYGSGDDRPDGIKHRR